MMDKTNYEYDVLASSKPGLREIEGMHSVPGKIFEWLELQALRGAESQDSSVWLRLTQRSGRPVVQVLNYVGVIQAPNGTQIEVLPKIGRKEEEARVRKLLVDMLRCLGGFRYILTDNASLSATKMPLLEVFIGEFLRSVEHVVKRDLRGDYTVQEDNLLVLRGKLMMSQHLRHNLVRADRFYSQFDEFTTNRPVNRLLHTALKKILLLTRSRENQRLAHELAFVFADVPLSDQPALDFQRIRFDRGMDHYENALAWTRLILNNESPLTGVGQHEAPSLLFPMEKVFEAYVYKHLSRKIAAGYTLKTQASNKYLVNHLERKWFRMKPDLLIRKNDKNHLVLDTKWKLIDREKDSRSQKYGLSQADFYQLHAYGQSYLNGEGNLALIYPKTNSFDQPLPIFQFLDTNSLRLWVLPFCLKSKTLHIPDEPIFQKLFSRHESWKNSQ